MADDDLDMRLALRVERLAAELRSLVSKVRDHTEDETPRLRKLERLAYYALGGLGMLGLILAFVVRLLLTR